MNFYLLALSYEWRFPTAFEGSLDSAPSFGTPFKAGVLSAVSDTASKGEVQNVGQDRTWDVAVTVYSYDRPRQLLHLLTDIAREADSAGLAVLVHVVDDNSLGCIFEPVGENLFDADTGKAAASDGRSAYATLQDLPAGTCTARRRFRHVENFLRSRSWPMFVSKYRHGRRRYWHLIRLAHSLLRHVKAAHYLFLPDDNRLSTSFFENVLAAWAGIDDKRKLTLMLHIEASREHVPVWTDFKPRVIGSGIIRIGWVESGNFLCGPEFLRFFDWSFPRVPVERWINNPPISSGVGATLSERIHAANLRMYRTEQSFVAHVGVTLSKMNAEFREPNKASLLTKHFADGDQAYTALLENATTVTASIASHWVRETALHSALDSLAPQVDHVNVYLNDYDIVPSFLRTPFVTVVRSQDRVASNGDIGDIGKFYWTNNLTTEFHLTADDDIVYPDDYVPKLLSFWRSYHAPLAVGVHGIQIKHDSLNPSRGRGKGYYGSREVWMAVEAVPEPVNVHIIGTGTMLYRPDDIGYIDLQGVFREPNMADLWFGILAQKLQLPMMVIPHREGWIQEVPGTFEDSIYKRSTRRRTSDRLQTKAAKAASPWTLHKATLAQ